MSHYLSYLGSHPTSVLELIRASSMNVTLSLLSGFSSNFCAWAHQSIFHECHIISLIWVLIQLLCLSSSEHLPWMSHYLSYLGSHPTSVLELIWASSMNVTVSLLSGFSSNFCAWAHQSIFHECHIISLIWGLIQLLCLSSSEHLPWMSHYLSYLGSHPTSVLELIRASSMNVTLSLLSGVSSNFCAWAHLSIFHECHIISLIWGLIQLLCLSSSEHLPWMSHYLSYLGSHPTSVLELIRASSMNVTLSLLSGVSSNFCAWAHQSIFHECHIISLIWGLIQLRNFAIHIQFAEVFVSLESPSEAIVVYRKPRSRERSYKIRQPSLPSHQLTLHRSGWSYVGF